ncbi:MAG: cupin domain-containing protein [Bacteroidales bacterium]
MKRIYLATLITAIVICANVMYSSCCNADESATTTTVVLLDAVETSWDGAALIDYPTGTPAITLLKITVPPKCKLPQHYHPVINVGYMLEGTLTVTDDKGNKKTVNAGDPIIETVNTIHYGENTGDINATIIVFYAAEKGATITEIADTYPN